VEVAVDVPRGVELGFAEFVRANTAALLRTGYLLTGNTSAAEELVQDTLVRLYPKWERVQAAEVPLAYVRRSVANAFVNERRRPASRVLRFELVPERADDRDATAAVVDRDELWPLLRALSARQRAALVLRYYHDLTDDQIAAVLDCRAGTVRSLISRGLATMREAADEAPAPWRLS
jgi:RNA polymerase sigma-70 factor (sigma-E family)